MFNYFSYVVIAEIYVFGPFFGHWVAGDENWASIIPTYWNGFKMVAKLPHKGMHPNYLAAKIWERHVFSLSGRKCYCFLCTWHPADGSPSQFQEVSCLGSSVVGIWCPIRIGACNETLARSTIVSKTVLGGPPQVAADIQHFVEVFLRGTSSGLSQFSDCKLSGRRDLLPSWHLVAGGYDELYGTNPLVQTSGKCQADVTFYLLDT